jgi:hypothetical protein
MPINDAEVLQTYVRMQCLLSQAPACVYSHAYMHAHAPQSFVVIAFLVLFNIFLAILVDAYFKMREECAHLMKRGAPEELADYAVHTCNRYVHVRASSCISFDNQESSAFCMHLQASLFTGE